MKRTNTAKYVFFTACLAGSLPVFAQQARKGIKKIPKTVAHEKTAGPDDNLNKTDARNRKQGMWFIRQKALRGEPAYIAFGSYVDDKKEGLWYKMDDLGQLESIENYTSGLLNGTSRYFESGKLVCIGNYRSLNPDRKYDSIWVTNPVTLYDSLVIVPSDLGTVKHGLWRYYDPESGQLVSEEKYQVDMLIYRKDFHYAPASDSIFYLQQSRHLPIDNKEKYSRPPKRFRKKIGY